MSEEVMIPKSYHDAVCEEMARRHQAEILELTKDRPQGEWKKNKTYKRIIFCSECGEPFEQSNFAEHWNFCPNCGARMKGADDE